MSDDLTTDNEGENDSEEEKAEKPPRSNNRIQDLSEKVKTTAEERDNAKREAEMARKDADFYKGFSTTASKYQGATEYQDEIKKKVDSGYTIEDATTSTLIAAGKFSNTPIQRESPAGGSASTSLRDSGEKSLAEMTHAEKREALEQMERESGGVSKILRQGLR